MFSRIVQFKIYGKIDEKLTQKVYKCIQETRLIKPKLVTVQIQGEGLLVQSMDVWNNFYIILNNYIYIQNKCKMNLQINYKCIATAIKNYARYYSQFVQLFIFKLYIKQYIKNRHKITIQVTLKLIFYRVPLYTFAEDFVMNSSVYLMTIGDKNFASEYSVIGDFGYVQRRLGYNQIKNIFQLYKQLMENLGIQHKFIHSGEKKVKLSPYDDLNEDDVKWIEGQLKHREQRLKEEIMQNRKQKVDQEMWNQTLFTGQQALKYGLIDGVGVFDDVREKEYKGMKTYDILSNLLDYYVPANATFSNYSIYKRHFTQQYFIIILNNELIKNTIFFNLILTQIYICLIIEQNMQGLYQSKFINNIKVRVINLFIIINILISYTKILIGKPILIHLIEYVIHINQLIKVSYFQIHCKSLNGSVHLLSLELQFKRTIIQSQKNCIYNGVLHIVVQMIEFNYNYYQYVIQVYCFCMNDILLLPYYSIINLSI